MMFFVAGTWVSVSLFATNSTNIFLETANSWKTLNIKTFRNPKPANFFVYKNLLLTHTTYDKQIYLEIFDLKRKMISQRTSLK